MLLVPKFHGWVKLIVMSEILKRILGFQMTQSSLDKMFTRRLRSPRRWLVLLEQRILSLCQRWSRRGKDLVKRAMVGIFPEIAEVRFYFLLQLEISSLKKILPLGGKRLNMKSFLKFLLLRNHLKSTSNIRSKGGRWSWKRRKEKDYQKRSLVIGLMEPKMIGLMEPELMG